MTDWPAIITACSAAFIGALHVLNQILHRRAIMRATPDQLQALEKMPVPSALIRRAGPSLLLLLLAAGLAVVAHGRDRQLAQWLSADPVAKTTDPGSRKSVCDEHNCPRPGRCVSGQCQDAAGKPLPRPQERARTRAWAGQPDSALVLPNTWDTTPRAFAERAKERW